MIFNVKASLKSLLMCFLKGGHLWEETEGTQVEYNDKWMPVYYCKRCLSTGFNPSQK